MERQHTENLFRRYKGKVVTVRAISGSVYQGQVGEITNDYVLLTDRQAAGDPQTFVLYEAIESVVVDETTD
jgi:ferredoxin-fold anticodon binding domain-containing protein